MLYTGAVTRLIDPLYSLVSEHWDVSLKLMYNIDIIQYQELDTRDFATYNYTGGNMPYLNEGAEQYCEDVKNFDGPANATQ